MLNLIGTYECKIDAKGRLMLPQAFKKQLASVLQDGFVLKRAVFQKCLELYPMAEWNALSQKVNKLNRFNKKNDEFIRRFNAGVKLVEMDGSGRILISKDLHAFAQTKKEIVVNAAINVLEIWDKDLYEKAIDEAALDFADLAEEVMGDQNEEPDGIS
ncbi:division/cell wall cluster transcriptional repressor MraZ [uncultured Dokdonia sp.]|uniref:division/cell wall cluster transcriptional repressor MraZ n=1 Tax=uncultured Dokdonia sp. TaxID=575653 RepID=UPI002607FE3F|nr:division/cell wall cluster transcriptional repressor MraZ [uncultured Dokdonia sp.]